MIVLNKSPMSKVLVKILASRCELENSIPIDPSIPDIGDSVVICRRLSSELQNWHPAYRRGINRPNDHDTAALHAPVSNAPQLGVQGGTFRIRLAVL
jgi:hypothetical protein